MGRIRRKEEARRNPGDRLTWVEGDDAYIFSNITGGVTKCKIVGHLDGKRITVAFGKFARRVDVAASRLSGSARSAWEGRIEYCEKERDKARIGLARVLADEAMEDV